MIRSLQSSLLWSMMKQPQMRSKSRSISSSSSRILRSRIGCHSSHGHHGSLLLIASRSRSSLLTRSPYPPPVVMPLTRTFSAAAASASASSASEKNNGIAFDLTGSFETHNLPDGGPTHSIVCSREELLNMFELMYTMRRMEITCDNEYKARNIRGFCHLYDGQEAVATGIQYALHAQRDSWITSYRCHCVALARGGTVQAIVGELFGVSTGMTGGKGGSMHFYNKQHNFFGGQGIVGAQVPVGTGLAFAAKYNHAAAPPGGGGGGGDPMDVAIACYGDGAANQGQIWEAANMASLWKLPMIFCIENNHYGMGTSIDRHSSISDYYKMGNSIPGLRIDGMNVLAVKQGVAFAKQYCGQAGNGPIYLEMMTYRYHGHSMSDPGTTYRNREEIAFTRSTRDPIAYLKSQLIETGVADETVLKEMEKRIRKHVQEQVMLAKQAPRPNPQTDLLSHIFALDLSDERNTEYPPHIRMPNYENSYWAAGRK